MTDTPIATPPAPLPTKRQSAQTMLPYALGELKALPAKIQAAVREARQATAEVKALPAVDIGTRMKLELALQETRTQKAAAIRKELSDAKASVDKHLTVLRQRGYGERDALGDMRHESQVGRAWDRMKPRLLAAANDPTKNVQVETVAIINEAASAKDFASLDAVREEIGAFLQNNTSAGANSHDRQTLMEGITRTLNGAEAKLSPDFALAEKVGAEVSKGLAAINQSLNTLEARTPGAAELVFDWPDGDGKIGQLPV